MARRSNGELAQQWRERLSRYRVCNVTVAEFCRIEGVSTAAFYNWKRRLGSTPAPGKPKKAFSPPEAPAFLPVNITGKSDTIEIELPNRALVRLPVGIDGDRLGEAIRAAGGASAGEAALC